ncbi:MAG: hypothetical protein WC253_02550 [Sulfurovaceae bacterium]|nr:hypothetical protein [Sulfurovaceae bacterium]
MNLESIDFKLFVETDNNPFILFDSSGHIIYLNNAAEMLLCYVGTKELYDLALTYAPKTFGHKSTIHSLEYESFSFYSLMVGYETDEQIYLRLYNKPLVQTKISISNESLISTDINTILEANITLFQLESNAAISLFVDQELPLFKLDQNYFSIMLRKALSSFVNSPSLNVVLKLIVGEYILIDDKKHQIIELILKAPERTIDHDGEIKQLANQTHITSSLKSEMIKFQIPLII